MRRLWAQRAILRLSVDTARTTRYRVVRMRRVPLRLLGALAALTMIVALAPGSALARSGGATSQSERPGVTYTTYRYGPLQIQPGQNTIDIDLNVQPGKLRPAVPGYIVSFEPNLTYLDGKVPRVDVLHLHHGVWLINYQPVFAAGEEKTNVDLPKGFGFDYKPSDRWAINYMIHNLFPNTAKVYLTYRIGFVPATAPAAKRMRAVHTVWMDVEGGKAYPVFDVLRTSGKNGRFIYPTQQPDAYRGGTELNKRVIDRDGVLVWTAGHLHPGGLYTDLWLTRAGRTVLVSRSRARYFEPAGAVSWDVAMTRTPAKWRVAVKRGDTLTVTGTYDSSRASWYESMAIMPVAMADGGGGVDPFATKGIAKPGPLTHGHLPENRHHGGEAAGLPDAAKLRSVTQPAGAPVTIKNFLYGLGDLSAGPTAGIPTVGAGQSVLFQNLEGGNVDGQRIYHTITACKSPCNRVAGIAYPLADAPIQFDSAELGFGFKNFTAAANRDSWSTPPNLPAGTYTYFCRIHPFMRGAFRVAQ